MIHAKKRQKWSKLHLKLQKEPEISMDFFLSFVNTKNGRRISNQPIKIKFIRFQVGFYN
jgi:hypothetical protein